MVASTPGAVDAPFPNTTVGVEANNAGVSLTVFVKNTVSISPSGSLTPVATVNTGTLALLTATVCSKLAAAVNTGSRLGAGGVTSTPTVPTVAVASPSLNTTTASQRPLVSTFNTPPRNSTVVASTPGAVDAPFPNTTVGVEANNAGVSLTVFVKNTVSISPSGSLTPVATVNTGTLALLAATVCSKLVAAVNTGARLGAGGVTSIPTVPISSCASPSLNTTTASQRPLVSTFNTPPRNSTVVASTPGAVDAPFPNTTVGVEANNAGVSLTVFVKNTVSISPSGSLTPVATVNTGTLALLAATVCSKLVAAVNTGVRLGSTCIGLTSTMTSPTSTCVAPSFNTTVAHQLPILSAATIPSRNSTLLSSGAASVLTTVDAPLPKTITGVEANKLSVSVCSLINDTVSTSPSTSNTSVATVNTGTALLFSSTCTSKLNST